MCLNKYHTMKTYFVLNQAPLHQDVWESEDIAPRILNLGSMKVSAASRPGCFIPVEKDPRVNWRGGWVGPRTGLDAVSEETNS